LKSTTVQKKIVPEKVPISLKFHKGTNPSITLLINLMPKGSL